MVKWTENRIVLSGKLELNSDIVRSLFRAKISHLLSHCYKLIASVDHQSMIHVSSHGRGKGHTI